MGDILRQKDVISESASPIKLMFPWFRNAKVPDTPFAQRVAQKTYLSQNIGRWVVIEVQELVKLKDIIILSWVQFERIRRRQESCKCRFGDHWKLAGCPRYGYVLQVVNFRSEICEWWIEWSLEDENIAYCLLAMFEFSMPFS